MRTTGENGREVRRDIVIGETGFEGWIPMAIACESAFMALALVDAGDISPSFGPVSGRIDVSIALGLFRELLNCSYESTVCIVARLSGGVGNSI